MVKYNNITEDAFGFLKCQCKRCGIEIRANKIFCSTKCKILYFREIRIGTYVNKKTQNKGRIFELSDILNKEDLKDMVKQTEINIAKMMNILKR